MVKLSTIQKHNNPHAILRSDNEDPEAAITITL